MTTFTRARQLSLSPCPGIAELNIYVRCIVKYIDAGSASCLGNRRVKYFHTFIVEYIDIVRTSCPGIGGLNISISLLWNILK
jgi:hypothetical protein